MSIPLSDNILNKSNKPDSAKFGPYANLVDACDPNIGVPDTYRAPGLFVGIQPTINDPVSVYWWPGPDYTDAGLVPFAPGGAGGAPQWVAGKQTGGSFVYDSGVVYRVKQDIANSQSAPGGNPANYLAVGPGAGGLDADGARDAALGRFLTSPTIDPTYNTVTKSLMAVVKPASLGTEHIRADQLYSGTISNVAQMQLATGANWQNKQYVGPSFVPDVPAGCFWSNTDYLFYFPFDNFPVRAVLA